VGLHAKELSDRMKGVSWHDTNWRKIKIPQSSKARLLKSEGTAPRWVYSAQERKTELLCASVWQLL
jgi:hypothetical protein